MIVLSNDKNIIYFGGNKPIHVPLVLNGPFISFKMAPTTKMKDGPQRYLKVTGLCCRPIVWANVSLVFIIFLSLFYNRVRYNKHS